MTKKSVVYEISMSILALIAVILAVIDIFQGLLPWQSVIDTTLLIVFIFDYFIRFFLSKNKKVFFKKNILDLIAIIPFNSAFKIFRVFKLFKLAKLARFAKFTKLIKMFAYFFRAGGRFRVFLDTNGFKYVLSITFILILSGGIAIHFAEGMSISDGIWWAFVTATTVGYGDISPDTLIGRVIAVFLMLTGIGMVGSLTSTITSFFMNSKKNTRSFRDDELALIMEKLNDIQNCSDDDINQMSIVLKTLNKK